MKNQEKKNDDKLKDFVLWRKWRKRNKPTFHKEDPDERLKMKEEIEAEKLAVKEDQKRFELSMESYKKRCLLQEELYSKFNSMSTSDDSGLPLSHTIGQWKDDVEKLERKKEGLPINIYPPDD